MREKGEPEGMRKKKNPLQVNSMGISYLVKGGEEFPQSTEEWRGKGRKIRLEFPHRGGKHSAQTNRQI